MPNIQEENKESLANTAFISEKIKQRPINRKKLFRRTVITVSLAVIFGIVACFTFLFLQPVFSDRLYPENEPEVISFPEETVTEELTPEEMFADDKEIAASEAMSLEANQRNQIDEAISSYSFNYRDYGKMMASLKSVATQASRSIVKVTAISSDTNWFSESYESSGQTSGLIVANSGSNLFILVPSTEVVDAESIRVTFCDNTKVSAVINQVDTVTNLCVLNVKKSYLSEETLESIMTANLGSSNLSTLTGLPVIALGSPIGIQGSISYGIITSEKTTIDMVDSCYKLITTDISGSLNGSGILVTLNGNVVGIIDMSHNPSDLSNSICAIGITELKSLIEDLSNGKERGYLGIHGSTVPDEIQEELQVPAGAYISMVEMGSPAMKAGVQSGDIITAVDDTEIVTYEQLINKLAGYSPDDIISITVMRQAPTDYIEMVMEATLTETTLE